jgi:hypothetical protein
MTAPGSTVSVPLIVPGFAPELPAVRDVALTSHQLSLLAELLLQNYGAEGLVQIAEYLLERPEAETVLAARQR